MISFARSEAATKQDGATGPQSTQSPWKPVEMISSVHPHENLALTCRRFLIPSVWNHANWLVAMVIVLALMHIGVNSMRLWKAAPRKLLSLLAVDLTLVLATAMLSCWPNSVIPTNSAMFTKPTKTGRAKWPSSTRRPSRRRKCRWNRKQRSSRKQSWRR